MSFTESAPFCPHNFIMSSTIVRRFVPIILLCRIRLFVSDIMDSFLDLYRLTSFFFILQLPRLPWLTKIYNMNSHSCNETITLGKLYSKFTIKPPRKEKFTKIPIFKFFQAKRTHTIPSLVWIITIITHMQILQRRFSLI